MPAKTLADCIIAASIGWAGAEIRVDRDDLDKAQHAGELAIYTQVLSPPFTATRPTWNGPTSWTAVASMSRSTLGTALSRS